MARATSTLTLSEHVEERERVTRANRVIRATCLFIATTCVALAGLGLFPHVQDRRKALELVAPNTHFEDMPPEVTLPAALLSTFRGLAVTVLWVRAEELKQDGKYYELQQLSDWICTLQPRFPKVWGNSAWNMSYNISVGTFTARERWHWVQAGANLLRDKGIVYNPKVVNLYYELAWIYLHKMGDDMDDHHRDYKRAFAVEIEEVLGKPPTEERAEDTIAPIARIAEAAAALEAIGPVHNPEVLEAYLASDSEISRFRSDLAEAGFEPDATMLKRLARLLRADLQLTDLLKVDPEAVLQLDEPDPTLSRFEALMADPKRSVGRDGLIAAVRAHVLLKELRLDAQRMLAIMERFGPLDWRSVYAHGLYWAVIGAEDCDEMIGSDVNVEMNVNRYILFGLKDTVIRGRIILEPDFDDPFNSFIQLLPDSRFIDMTHETMLSRGKELQGREPDEKYYAEGPAGRHFKSGHVNFLHQAIRTLWLDGYVSKAQSYYDYLRDNYVERDGRVKTQYLKTLQAFVFQDLIEDVDSFKSGPVIMDSLVSTAYLYLAYSRSEQAATRMRLAKDAYDSFMATKEVDRNERRRLPPWPKFKAQVLARFLQYQRFDPGHEMVLKARVWDRVDTAVKLEVYRAIEVRMRELCDAHNPPLDFDKAFEAPVGLKEFEAGLFEDTEEKPLDAMDSEQGRKR
jgi:hypothetical protein